MKIKWKLNHVILYILYLYSIRYIYTQRRWMYKKNTFEKKMIYDIKGKVWNNYKLLRLTGQNKQDVVCNPRYGKHNLSKNRIKLHWLH